MSRRLLIVEPDGPGRAMMDRVLTSEGYSPETCASAREARAILDAGLPEAVIIDELSGSGTALEEVRWLRSRYPTVPVIVTGAMLSRREMQELLRMRVADALAKPFTPVELREAVARVIDQNAAHHDEALEYDAALTDARRAIAAGLGRRGRGPLSRAQAMSPFDAEVMALRALSAELDGDDTDADRGYRAALALRDDEASSPPNPHEGLARLAAYGGARPVTELRPERADGPYWLVTDPTVELRGGAPEPDRGGKRPQVVVMALGLNSEGPGAVFLRDGEGPLAFALLSGALRPEPFAAALVRLGPGPIVAAEPTRSRLDLGRIEELRKAPPPAR